MSNYDTVSVQRVALESFGMKLTGAQALEVATIINETNEKFCDSCASTLHHHLKEMKDEHENRMKEDVTDRPEFTETMFNISCKVGEWYGRLELDDKIAEGIEDSRTLPSYARNLAIEFEKQYDKRSDYVVAIDSFIQDKLYNGEDVKLPSETIRFKQAFELEDYADDDCIVRITLTKEEYINLRDTSSSDGTLYPKLLKAMAKTPQDHFFTEITRRTAESILARAEDNTQVYRLYDHEDSEAWVESLKDMAEYHSDPNARFGIQ